jgi:hypothetical protein
MVRQCVKCSQIKYLLVRLLKPWIGVATSRRNIGNAFKGIVARQQPARGREDLRDLAESSSNLFAWHYLANKDIAPRTNLGLYNARSEIASLDFAKRLHCFFLPRITHPLFPADWVNSVNRIRIAITVVAASFDCVPARSPLCHSIVIRRVTGNYSES